MRKTLIQTLLAAFCAILAHTSLEGGGVMLINMRNAMLSGGKRTLTAKDYVQDGLYLQLDAIENTGYGTHDDNPSNFADLTGNFSFTKYSSPNTVYSTVFSADSLQGQPYLCSAASKRPEDILSKLTGDATFELVFSYDSSIPNVGFGGVGAGNWINIAGFVGARILVYNRGNGNYITPPSGVKTISIALSVSNGVMLCYCNGEPKLTLQAGTMSAPTSIGHMYVGQNLNLANNTNYFAARSNRMYFYSRALAASEIAANYAIDKARFKLPDVT